MLQPSEVGRTRAILAHITTIGWIIALIMNSKGNDKNEFASFYIRQVIGIVILGLFSSFVGVLLPILGIILPVLFFGLLIYSLIGSIKGEYRLIPIFGDKIQELFKDL